MDHHTSLVNIFSIKKYKSLRKLRVGVNRYTGVNWSTTTRSYSILLLVNGYLIKVLSFMNQGRISRKVFDLAQSQAEPLAQICTFWLS